MLIEDNQKRMVVFFLNERTLTLNLFVQLNELASLIFLFCKWSEINQTGKMLATSGAQLVLVVMPIICYEIIS